MVSIIPDKLKSKLNADRLLAAPPMLRLFLCLLCGMVTASALPPTYLIFNAFMGLSLFYVLLYSFSEHAKQAVLASWLFGFGYFTIGLYWIGNALLVDGEEFLWAYPFAILGLPAVLALFNVAGTYTMRRLHIDLRTPQGFLAFIGIITLAEYLRGTLFTGFPWNLYGTIWAEHLSILQFVSIGGIYTLTLFTAFWCCTIGYLVLSNNRKATDTIFVLSLLSFALISSFGTNRLSRAETGMQPDISLRVVQPDIAQQDKWNYDKINENFNTLLTLSHPEAEHDKNTTTVIVWPETATHSDMTGRSDYGSAIRHIMPENSYLITGILDRKDLADGRAVFNNSIAVFDQNMIRRDIYNKSHLVPFGEYIPFGKYLPFSPVANTPGFEGGNGPKTLHDDEGLPPFSPLICYEIIFPGRVKSYDRNDPPSWIVNVSNDGWYGDSTGPYQHLVSAQFRAAEEGIPVVRSANTGISAVINAYGEVLQSLPLGSRGTIESGLPQPAPERTVFSRFGNIIFFIFLAATLGCALIIQNRSKASS